MARPPLIKTHEQAREIERLLRRGYSIDNVALETGISKWAIARFRLKLTLPRFKHRESNKIRYSMLSADKFLSDLNKYHQKLDSIQLRESSFVRMRRQLTLSPNSCALTWEN
jgi:hypothetical protein